MSAGEPEAKSMTTQTGVRRSERVLLDVPVVVCGDSPDHRAFREETFTVTVSAHGALLMLENKVAVGQKIVVMNPKNWDERECRVAYIGPDRAGLAQVAVEFPQASPDFWSLESPPSNWKMN
jgi:hypothetical protein